MTITRRKRKHHFRGLPFQPGFDARRHILTQEERRRGGYTTLMRYYLAWMHSAAEVPPCPRCGGPTIADLYYWRCTRCGFTWCNGCRGKGKRGAP